MVAAAERRFCQAHRFVAGDEFWRGVVSIVAFLMFWEVGRARKPGSGSHFRGFRKFRRPPPCCRRCSSWSRIQAFGTARF